MAYRKYMASLTAEQLIAFIARSPWELSHDKVRDEYTDFKLGCRDWLEKNNVEHSTRASFHEEL